MPEDGLSTLRGFDAIYFGAHGDPARMPGSVSSQGLMHPIRKGFDQYVHMRPILLLPGVTFPICGINNIDFVVVRENSEGEYSGIGGRLHSGTPEETAVQTTVITRKESGTFFRTRGR